MREARCRAAAAVQNLADIRWALIVPVVFVQPRIGERGHKFRCDGHWG
jgi:hypothetical protein